MKTFDVALWINCDAPGQSAVARTTVQAEDPEALKNAVLEFLARYRPTSDRETTAL